LKCPPRAASLAPVSPAVMDDPLLGRLLGGRFRLSARMGHGAIASVYRAGAPHREAAVKVLDELYAGAPPFRRRFEREVALTERLSGQGAPRALGAGEIDGRPWLALELLPGRPLADRRAEGPIPPREAVAITRALLDALAPAHRLGIVHRDLKPGNVMLLPGGAVKLLDFGTAAAASDEALGTPAYAAPEQAAGHAVDARADLYAAGVLLYEMACGRRPFEGDPIALLEAHAAAPPPPPRDLSHELETVILRALAKSPADRFETGDAMREALSHVPEST
jgi:eukaryotic-like serine/threonine-protein kinase